MKVRAVEDFCSGGKVYAKEIISEIKFCPWKVLFREKVYDEYYFRSESFATELFLGVAVLQLEKFCSSESLRREKFIQK